MRAAALALPFVLALVLLVPGVLAQTNGPLIVTVTGPTGVAPGAKILYNITMSGGPTGNVSYTVTWYLTGANTSGGSPLPAAPGHTTANVTSLQINITAPSVQGDINLVAMAVASEPGLSPENYTTSYAITVISPIVLSATFHNGGSTLAANITVRWYIDGALVGTSKIAQIAPNADATVSFNYLPVGLSDGQHTVTATADLDHDGVINPARGEVATSTVFYNQPSPPATGWVVLLGIGIFIPVFIGVVAIRRRGQR